MTGHDISNSAATPPERRFPPGIDPNSADWKDGYDTGFAEAESGVFNRDGSYKDATRNRVQITVSEKTADWITAKAMEHGCDEDEVIATLIADWNEATA